MVTMRGDPSELARATGLDAPGMRLSTTDGADSLLWMSPDELLLICDDAPTRASRLADALYGSFAAVADVSDARAVFDLAGPGATATLAKLMPVDFAAMAPGEVRRSRLAQVPAATWRHGDGWRIVCFRSVAVYVEAALCNAADGAVPPLYGA